jgi:heterotetrameric sarcosine oxidase gamma subunit
MRDLEARSPLAECADALPAVRNIQDTRLREAALSVLGIRACREEYGREIGERLGITLPASPNEAAKLGDGWIICTAPNDWRAISPPTTHRGALAALADIATEFALVTDLGSAACVIEISGAGARRTIASGCALDLHERVFKTGNAASSRLVDFPVLILKISEKPCFLVVSERFHALTVWDWLVDAANAS